MNKLLSGALIAAVIVTLVGCGQSAESEKSSGTENSILDLQGTWKQTNGAKDSWQEAVIAGDTIEICWVSDGGDTKSLYWAGTYDAPTTSEDSFSWESKNDKSLTEGALLASLDDSKKIDYKNGVMSYTTTLSGTSKKIKLERESDEIEMPFTKDSSETSDSSEGAGSAADTSQSETNAVADASSATGESSDIYLSSMPGSKEDILKNIEVKTDKDKNGVMAVFITNNNGFVIPDLDVQVIFYKNDKLSDSEEDGHDVVLPGSTVVSRIDCPQSYDNFEVKIDVGWVDAVTYRNWANGVTLESSIGDGNVMMKFTNNNDVDIEELEYNVLLYNKGKLVQVCYPKDAYDFKAGDTIIKKEDASVEFDDFKVYINQAHTFSMSGAE